MTMKGKTMKTRKDIDKEFKQARKMLAKLYTSTLSLSEWKKLAHDLEAAYQNELRTLTSK